MLRRMASGGLTRSVRLRVQQTLRASRCMAHAATSSSQLASESSGADASNFAAVEQVFLNSWEENLTGSDSLAGPRDASWWTGKAPEACAGFKDGKLHSLPLVSTEASREELQDYFDNTWTTTEVQFAGLKGEEPFFRPPWHDLRHPLIFYYGHTACVYVNKMRLAGLLDKPVDPFAEKVLQTGVDEFSWDDMHKNVLKWPSVAEIGEYRRQVYDIISEAIATSPDYSSLAELGPQSPFWALVMGFEHERIHIETSSVLMRELPISLVQPPAAWPGLADGVPAPEDVVFEPVAGVDYPANAMIDVPAGAVTLGKPDDWPTFGWDNEYGSRTLDVAAFAASKYKVSNGEFFEFVKSDGYLNPEYWSKDGWAWRSFRNIRWPTFWVNAGPHGLHQYALRTIYEEVPMPWSWPVNVNYYEAQAFARWKAAQACEPAYRVITEAEHNRIRDVPQGTDPIMTPAFAKQANINLAHGSEGPVNAYPANAHGFHDVFGGVWEWCEDHFNALDDFQPHPYYADFSIPCFDGKHNIITGGSFASTGDEASVFARFHFRPHFYQHAGFRVVASDADLRTSCMDNPGPYAGPDNPFRSSPSPAPSSSTPTMPSLDLSSEALAGVMDKYEDRTVLQQYLSMHYGLPSEFPEWVPEGTLQFPQRCAHLVSSAASKDRVLDIGCAVGASAFELAREFKEVRALDISAEFINTANYLKAVGCMPYEIQREGSLSDAYVARVDSDIDRTRVTFEQGDATALDPDYLGTYDAILIGNVLCRLPDPYDLLSVLPDLVNQGGTLAITSPFSWLPQFTPPEKWLGGNMCEDTGVARDSARTLLAYLDSVGFELVEESNMSFVIREHLRKYEHVTSHVGVWRRR